MRKWTRLVFGTLSTRCKKLFELSEQKITHTLSTCHCEQIHICAMVKYSPGSQLENSLSPYLRCASGREPTASIRRGDAKPGWFDLVSLAGMLKLAAPYGCHGPHLPHIAGWSLLADVLFGKKKNIYFLKPVKSSVLWFCSSFNVKTPWSAAAWANLFSNSSSPQLGCKTHAVISSISCLFIFFLLM